MDDEESYVLARPIYFDDDHHVAVLSEQDIELIRLRCLDRDIASPELNDLNHSHEAYAEDRDDELLKALEANDNMKIHKGLVFKDLPTLRR